MNKLRILLTAFVLIGAVDRVALADPPGRVARVSFLSGTVSFRRAAATDWTQATLNYPITIGDHLWTDPVGRLELQLGGTALDVDRSTAIGILNLDHDVIQVRLTQGTVIARVHELAENEALELDTPNGAVTLLRPGLYRVDVGPEGDSTTVTVRRGDIEIAAGAAAFPVHPGQSASLVGVESVTHEIRAAVGLDEFEDWVTFRDRPLDGLASVRYVPRGLVGYEDLDEFGSWRVVATYGPVWVPHVRIGWVPYRFGHWAWVDPWGWTWIDDAPWGFAPFHYGRWVYVTDGWAWVPGTIVARPVYSPALVAFIGGSNWHLGIGIGQPVGWFPLGPREVFVPAYQVSPAYVAAINQPHVTVTNINVNITKVTYVNQSVAGAVTVVPRATFVQAAAVAPSAVAVTPASISGAAVVGHSAPTDVGRPVIARAAPAAAPPAAIVNRPVVVKAPPAANSAPAVVNSAPAQVTRVPPAVNHVPPAVNQVPPTPNTPAHGVNAAPPVGNAAPHVVNAAPSAANNAAPPVKPPPPPVYAKAAAPDRFAADMVTRHAQERIDIEARHAAERADLEARHRAEAQRASGARAQAEIRARQERDRADLEARQKQEHEQLQQRQETERRRRRAE